MTKEQQQVQVNVISSGLLSVRIRIISETNCVCLSVFLCVCDVLLALI